MHESMPSGGSAKDCHAAAVDSLEAIIAEFHGRVPSKCLRDCIRDASAAASRWGGIVHLFKIWAEQLTMQPCHHSRLLLELMFAWLDFGSRDGNPVALIKLFKELLKPWPKCPPTLSQTVGEALAEATSTRQSFGQGIAMAILTQATAEDPETITKERCFTCLVAFLQRLELLQMPQYHRLLKSVVKLLHIILPDDIVDIPWWPEAVCRHFHNASIGCSAEALCLPVPEHEAPVDPAGYYTGLAFDGTDPSYWPVLEYNPHDLNPLNCLPLDETAWPPLPTVSVPGSPVPSQVMTVQQEPDQDCGRLEAGQDFAPVHPPEYPVSVIVLQQQQPGPEAGASSSQEEAASLQHPADVFAGQVSHDCIVPIQRRDSNPLASSQAQSFCAYQAPVIIAKPWDASSIQRSSSGGEIWVDAEDSISTMSTPGCEHDCDFEMRADESRSQSEIHMPATPQSFHNAEEFLAPETARIMSLLQLDNTCLQHSGPSAESIPDNLAATSAASKFPAHQRHQAQSQALASAASMLNQQASQALTNTTPNSARGTFTIAGKVWDQSAAWQQLPKPQSLALPASAASEPPQLLAKLPANQPEAAGKSLGPAALEAYLNAQQLPTNLLVAPASAMSVFTPPAAELPVSMLEAAAKSSAVEPRDQSLAQQRTPKPPSLAAAASASAANVPADESEAIKCLVLPVAKCADQSASRQQAAKPKPLAAPPTAASEPSRPGAKLLEDTTASAAKNSGQSSAKGDSHSAVQLPAKPCLLPTSASAASVTKQKAAHTASTADMADTMYISAAAAMGGYAAFQPLAKHRSSPPTTLAAIDPTEQAAKTLSSAQAVAGIPGAARMTAPGLEYPAARQPTQNPPGLAVSAADRVPKAAEEVQASGPTPSRLTDSWIANLLRNSLTTGAQGATEQRDAADKRPAQVDISKSWITDPSGDREEVKSEGESVSGSSMSGGQSAPPEVPSEVSRATQQKKDQKKKQAKKAKAKDAKAKAAAAAAAKENEAKEMQALELAMAERRLEEAAGVNAKDAASGEAGHDTSKDPALLQSGRRTIRMLQEQNAAKEREAKEQEKRSQPEYEDLEQEFQAAVNFFNPTADPQDHVQQDPFKRMLRSAKRYSSPLIISGWMDKYGAAGQVTGPDNFLVSEEELLTLEWTAGGEEKCTCFHSEQEPGVAGVSCQDSKLPSGLLDQILGFTSPLSQPDSAQCSNTLETEHAHISSRLPMASSGEMESSDSAAEGAAQDAPKTRTFKCKAGQNPECMGVAGALRTKTAAASKQPGHGASISALSRMTCRVHGKDASCSLPSSKTPLKHEAGFDPEVFAVCISLHQLLIGARAYESSVFMTSGLGAWEKSDAAAACTLLTAACTAADVQHRDLLGLHRSTRCYFHHNNGLQGWESDNAYAHVSFVFTRLQYHRVQGSKSQKPRHRHSLQHAVDEAEKALDSYQGSIDLRQALIRLAQDAASAAMHPNLVAGLVSSLGSRAQELEEKLGQLELIPWHFSRNGKLQRSAASMTQLPIASKLLFDNTLEVFLKAWSQNGSSMELQEAFTIAADSFQTEPGRVAAFQAWSSHIQTLPCHQSLLLADLTRAFLDYGHCPRDSPDLRRPFKAILQPLSAPDQAWGQTVGEALAELAPLRICNNEVTAIFHAAAGKKPVREGLRQNCFAAFASYVTRRNLMNNLEVNHSFMMESQSILVKLLPLDASPVRAASFLHEAGLEPLAEALALPPPCPQQPRDRDGYFTGLLDDGTDPDWWPVLEFNPSALDRHKCPALDDHAWPALSSSAQSPAQSRAQPAESPSQGAAGFDTQPPRSEDAPLNQGDALDASRDDDSRSISCSWSQSPPLLNGKGAAESSGWPPPHELGAHRPTALDEGQPSSMQYAASSNAAHEPDLSAKSPRHSTSQGPSTCTTSGKFQDAVPASGQVLNSLSHSQRSPSSHSQPAGSVLSSAAPNSIAPQSQDLNPQSQPEPLTSDDATSSEAAAMNSKPPSRHQSRSTRRHAARLKNQQAGSAGQEPFNPQPETMSVDGTALPAVLHSGPGTDAVPAAAPADSQPSSCQGLQVQAVVLAGSQPSAHFQNEASSASDAAMRVTAEVVGEAATGADAPAMQAVVTGTSANDAEHVRRIPPQLASEPDSSSAPHSDAGQEGHIQPGDHGPSRGRREKRRSKAAQASAPHAAVGGRTDSAAHEPAIAASSAPASRSRSHSQPQAAEQPADSIDHMQQGSILSPEDDVESEAALEASPLLSVSPANADTKSSMDELDCGEAKAGPKPAPHEPSSSSSVNADLQGAVGGNDPNEAGAGSKSVPSEPASSGNASKKKKKKKKEPVQDDDQLLAEAMALAQKESRALSEKQAAGSSRPHVKSQDGAKLKQNSDAPFHPSTGKQQGNGVKPGKKLSAVERLQLIKERQAKEEHDCKHAKVLVKNQQQMLLQNQLEAQQQKEQQQQRQWQQGSQEDASGMMAKFLSLTNPGLMTGDPFMFADREKMKAEGQSAMEQHYASWKSASDLLRKGKSLSKELPSKANGALAPKKEYASRSTSTASSSAHSPESQAELQQHILEQYLSYCQNTADFKPSMLRQQLTIARMLEMELPYDQLLSMCGDVQPRWLSETAHSNIQKQLRTPQNQVTALQSRGRLSQQGDEPPTRQKLISKYCIRGDCNLSNENLSDKLGQGLFNGLSVSKDREGMDLADQDLMQPLLGKRQQPQDSSSRSSDAALWSEPWSQGAASVKKAPPFGQKPGTAGPLQDLPDDFFGPALPRKPGFGHPDKPSAAMSSVSSVQSKFGSMGMLDDWDSLLGGDVALRLTPKVKTAMQAKMQHCAKARTELAASDRPRSSHTHLGVLASSAEAAPSAGPSVFSKQDAPEAQAAKSSQQAGPAGNKDRAGLGQAKQPISKSQALSSRSSSKSSPEQQPARKLTSRRAHVLSARSSSSSSSSSDDSLGSLLDSLDRSSEGQPTESSATLTQKAGQDKSAARITTSVFSEALRRKMSAASMSSKSKNVSSGCTGQAVASQLTSAGMQPHDAPFQQPTAHAGDAAMPAVDGAAFKSIQASLSHPAFTSQQARTVAKASAEQQVYGNLLANVTGSLSGALGKAESLAPKPLATDRRHGHNGGASKLADKSQRSPSNLKPDEPDLAVLQQIMDRMLGRVTTKAAGPQAQCKIAASTARTAAAFLEELQPDAASSGLKSTFKKSPSSKGDGASMRKSAAAFGKPMPGAKSKGLGPTSSVPGLNAASAPQMCLSGPTSASEIESAAERKPAPASPGYNEAASTSQLSPAVGASLKAPAQMPLSGPSGLSAGSLSPATDTASQALSPEGVPMDPVPPSAKSSAASTSADDTSSPQLLQQNGSPLSSAAPSDQAGSPAADKGTPPALPEAENLLGIGQSASEMAQLLSKTLKAEQLLREPSLLPSMSAKGLSPSAEGLNAMGAARSDQQVLALQQQKQALDEYILLEKLIVLHKVQDAIAAKAAGDLEPGKQLPDSASRLPSLAAPAALKNHRSQHSCTSSLLRTQAAGKDVLAGANQHLLASLSKLTIDSILRSMGDLEEASGSSSSATSSNQVTLAADSGGLLNYESLPAESKSLAVPVDHNQQGAASLQGSETNRVTAHSSCNMHATGRTADLKEHAAAHLSAATLPVSSHRPSTGSETTAADGVMPGDPASSNSVSRRPSDASLPQRFKSQVPLMPAHSKPAVRMRENQRLSSVPRSQAPLAPPGTMSSGPAADVAGSAVAPETQGPLSREDAQAGVAPRLLSQWGGNRSTASGAYLSRALVESSTDSDDEPSEHGIRTQEPRPVARSEKQKPDLVSGQPISIGKLAEMLAEASPGDTL
ncbi:hypothetical protein WJX74_000911 [Apatococcus lobatus]|uniref:Uncharacterized protein n=1 Tax=Apatococcus lobatus TaxID=904363 RepID=A0AAW1QDS5_9CHLO